MLHENDVLPRGTESPFLSALHAKNNTTNLFGYKLGESTETNKALLFVRKQFKLLAVPLKPLRCCLRSDKLVNCHFVEFCNCRYYPTYNCKTQQNATLPGQEIQGYVQLKVF